MKSISGLVSIEPDSKDLEPMALTTIVFRLHNSLSKLLPGRPFFKHTEYKNNYTCLFAFTATSSLQEFDRNFIEIDWIY